MRPAPGPTEAERPEGTGHAQLAEEASATPTDIEQRNLRRSDLKAGLLLCLLSLAMLWKAGEFPLADSYGGVQNAWYVSPALMPLIVGSALLILSLVLTANAVRYAQLTGGAAKLLRESGAKNVEYRVRLSAVVLFFSGFIYAFTPNVDFFIATLLFLSCFVVSFYLELPAVLRFNALFYLVSSVAVALASQVAVLEQTIHYPLDILAGSFFLAFLTLNVRMIWSERGAQVKFVRALSVSSAVTLIVVVIFKYGLLVPLPTEGAAIRGMDSIQAMIRGSR